MSDYLCRLIGHYGSGRPWSTRFYLSSTAPPSSVLTSLATNAGDYWSNGSHGLNTLYHTTTIFDSVEVILLNGSLKYQQRNGPTSLALAGTSSDTAGPDIDSVVVSLRTANVGPGEIGKMKLPSPVEGTIVNGEFDATPQTRVGVASRAFITAMTGGGATWFIFNREATISKPTPLTRSTIITAECSNIIGTVRRRVKHANRTYA
jgi:hypothetical protein